MTQACAIHQILLDYQKTAHYQTTSSDNIMTMIEDRRFRGLDHWECGKILCCRNGRDRGIGLGDITRQPGISDDLQLSGTLMSNEAVFD